jgi:hypothetical protein
MSCGAAGLLFRCAPELEQETSATNRNNHCGVKNPAFIVLRRAPSGAVAGHK